MHAIAAPPRTVGFWGTALFPLNGMIGAGVFALPAVLAASVGSFAPWIVLVGGLLFMPLALVYAWISARFERSGGVVLYGEAAMGRFVGFQAGWARYASAVVTIAANMHVLVTYLAVIFPAIGGLTVRPFAVAGIIAAATIINLIGMRSAVSALGAMTLVKLVPLLALIVAAFFRRRSNIGFVLPGFREAETVLLLTYYAFMGFENVVAPARTKASVPILNCMSTATTTRASEKRKRLKPECERVAGYWPCPRPSLARTRRTAGPPATRLARRGRLARAYASASGRRPTRVGAAARTA
jgi:amino acid transporter